MRNVSYANPVGEEAGREKATIPINGFIVERDVPSKHPKAALPFSPPKRFASQSTRKRESDA